MSFIKFNGSFRALTRDTFGWGRVTNIYVSWKLNRSLLFARLKWDFLFSSEGVSGGPPSQGLKIKVTSSNKILGVIQIEKYIPKSNCIYTYVNRGVPVSSSFRPRCERTRWNKQKSSYLHMAYRQNWMGYWLLKYPNLQKFVN